MIHKDTKEQQTQFTLGSVCITPGAQEALSHEDVMAALGRHCRGDWGDVCAEDREENNLSVREGFRLLSAYQSRSGRKFWIITEADRSVTTILLPDEY